jgi:hypothetical protein
MLLKQKIALFDPIMLLRKKTFSLLFKKKYKIKKAPFTLIEVILALGLASIVLFFLFSSLKSSMFISSKLAKERASISSRDFFHQRLLQIFSKVDPKSISVKTINGLPSLYLVFDNGADPIPLFAGKLEGLFTLNSHGSILFEIHPVNDPLSTRKELLLERIKSIEWTVLKGSLLASVTEINGRSDRYPIFFPSETEGGHTLGGQQL